MGSPAYDNTRKHRLPVQPVQADSDEYLDDEEGLDEKSMSMRSPSSTRMYVPRNADGSRVIKQGNRQYIVHDGLPPMPRRASREAPSTEPQYTQSNVAAKNKPHWLLVVGLLLLVMLLGWMAVSAFLNWWQVTMDDWHYGRPRTYQVDARVGHNDSRTPSHFIALNLDDRVQIIECPAGDCSHAIAYIGADTSGDGQDLATVTLEFKDVNGDGKLDMLIHVANQTIVFLNEGGKFRPASPSDHISP